MSRLNEIFKNPDARARLKELVEYAKSLKINVLKAKKEDGTYSEDELAILIFDAEHHHAQNKRVNVAFFIAGGTVLAFLILSLYFAAKLIQLKPGKMFSETPEMIIFLDFLF